MAAIHCQQAVEKALKGLLVVAEREVPRVHDLSRLYVLARDAMPVDLDLQVLELANQFYIETRYPLHEDREPIEPTTDQLGSMIALAEEALDALRSRL